MLTYGGSPDSRTVFLFAGLLKVLATAVNVSIFRRLMGVGLCAHPAL